MLTPKIETSKRVVPMIYAYTTPGITYHDGYIKIGYTEQDVDTRIRQQTHTAGVMAKKEWQGNAVFDDGSGEPFKDYHFHAYLRKNGVKQPQDLNNKYFNDDDKNEWFFIGPKESKNMFNDFRSDHGITKTNTSVIAYNLRAEQKEAVRVTKTYFENTPKGEFLWNAKPRFGKTLTVYDLCIKINAKNVLIVTNRPAIANSWYSDYVKFLGNESGYIFVSEVDALRGRKGVLSRKEFEIHSNNRTSNKLIEFVSLQDMKGSIYFGGQYNKLKEISKESGIEWDLLVIDEAHEGVDTYKTDVAFEQINRKFTLHLSGTPFKALANNNFSKDAIFNYTYADEQKNKRDWNIASQQENPYIDLPKLNLFTYQMSEIIKDELSKGIDINGETKEYAFDLNEFFSTNNDGNFVYNSSVDKFLDALTLQKKFPFSTDELRNELKHTFWILDRVDSAKALVKKLREHPIFKDYEIVLAAGDGKIDDDDANIKSYDKVVKAIKENEKTITISVGQLTTGITIPQWTGVLMLSNMKSPALYMQAAFRAQNPCMFTNGTEYRRKENAYVFDFDPARTLIIFEEFANDLSINTAVGRGDVETRKSNVKQLLNFFPVIGEDEQGELIELDAEKVLTIPRKIRSVEVVKCGFMSNFLFQNIGSVFSAQKEVLDIINKFEVIKNNEKNKKNKVNKGNIELSKEEQRKLFLDENGEVTLDNEYVIGKSTEIFGEKIYGKVQEEQLNNIVMESSDEPNDLKKQLKNYIKDDIVKNIVATTQEKYGNNLEASDKKRIESKLNFEAGKIVDKTVSNYEIEKKVIEQERIEAMQSRHKTGKSTDEINKEFEQKIEIADNKFKEGLLNIVDNFTHKSEQETVLSVETQIKERERDGIESGIKDHLRGFTRTIPAFLMAYGDENVSLATFDKILPDDVFLEVTGITIDQFKFLRDGGTYFDSDTGEEKIFKGQLFDSVVFDDSVKEFLNLKNKLADYFDENNKEDIFDYIPPQKTNQIFTPKSVVKKMVDMLEQENPGCFDMHDRTFVDLYMKSGMYIAEIAKRLFRSEKLKQLYPDKTERLKHIFEKQLFGFAPTKIIYKISTSYILGFDKNLSIEKHNLKFLDVLPYIKAGTLEEAIDKEVDMSNK